VGYLVQDKDAGHLGEARYPRRDQRQPTEAQMADLRFAWTVAKHVKSNAIVYAKDGATVGVGAGQMSRIDSTRIAARKAHGHGRGAAVMATTPGQGVGRGLGCVLSLCRWPDGLQPKRGLWP
jgi:AICAR transformylase/IMP cyclohydrolase PurH